jgi:NADH-quinone oxidoreductase subunit K
MVVLDAAGQAGPYSPTPRTLGKLLYTEYLYPGGDRRRHPAGGHDRRHRADAARRKDSKHIDPSMQVACGRATACASGQADATQKPAQKPASEPAGPRRKSMTLTLGHFLSLGAMLFALSVIGIFLNRKNLIILLMAIELMLLAVNMNFVAFSHYLGDMHGQVFVFFILTVAAAESAIGLAILVLLFRNKSSINVDELNTLKG